MIQVYVDCPPSFSKCAEYVLAEIFNILKMPCAFSQSTEDHFDVYYGRNDSLARKARIAILGDDYANWVRFKPSISWIDGIPVLHTNRKPKNIVTREGENATFQFDFVMACFYLLARIEEIVDSRRDQWSCFSGKYSVLYELGILEVPIVNLYCQVLMQLLSSMLPDGVRERRTEWKDGKRFAVALTHDVDTPLRGYRGAIGRMLQKSSFIAPAKPRDPYWNFDNWIALEQKYGFKSAFFFYASADRHPLDPHYDIGDALFSKLIRKIDDLGWEVGLHGSYQSYNNAGLLLKEKARLERILKKNIEGVRQHYLRFDIRSTWKEQSRAGFLYDATLGYNEALGFRAGIAHPFHAFSEIDSKRLAIVELPLTIMDGVLFSEAPKDIEGATRRCLAILERTKESGGCASILWHQRVWDDKDYPGWREVYENILRHLRKEDAWVTSPNEIVKWCGQQHAGLSDTML